MLAEGSYLLITQVQILWAVLLIVIILGPYIGWTLGKKQGSAPVEPAPPSPDVTAPVETASPKEAIRVKAEVLDEAERIKELERLRTTFYTNITHEFRTPLTVISGMADILQSSKGDREESLDMIKRNSANLLTLINQMLDLSKLDAGAMTLKMIRGDVTAHINYIIESLSSFANQQGVEVTCSHEHSPYEMDYDAEKLMQVLSNLISNGVKFTPDGGKVDVWTHVTTTGGVELFHISVRDTGIGIGKEHLPYIFDRFYRIEDTALKTSKGTGVGLALTKDLVQLMQGEIDLRSATGEGATFHVTLPVTRVARPDTYEIGAETVRLASGAYVEGTAPISTDETRAIVDEEQPLILVVEDNPDVARYIGLCLDDEYRLAYASDGEAGIETATEIIPDIIITDVMMPKRDGFDVTNTLKNDERTNHIPIIMLTARADMESKIAGLERGADAYMNKPFDKVELTVRVRKLLDLRKALQKRYASGTVPDSPSEGIRVEDAFVRKANEAIHANLEDPDFGIMQLARAVTLSRAQLHNKLKALTGRSTGLYIRYIRLLKARDLLKNPELNVSEVAYDVGFKDPAYFTRCFKEEFGKSPTDYREQL